MKFYLDTVIGAAINHLTSIHREVMMMPWHFLFLSHFEPLLPLGRVRCLEGLTHLFPGTRPGASLSSDSFVCKSLSDAPCRRHYFIMEPLVSMSFDWHANMHDLCRG